MQIGTQKNGGWWNCEMADYLYSVAIQVNSFHNNNIMADKMVWQINRGRLMNIHCILYVHTQIGISMNGCYHLTSKTRTTVYA